MAYSKDFKAAALAAVDAGKDTKTKIAELFGITREGLRKRRRERDAERAGTRPPKRKTGPKPKLAAAEPRLRELVAAKNDGTIAHYHQQLGEAVHPRTVGRALRRLGLTFKKRPSAPTNVNAPTSPRGAPLGRRKSRRGPRPAGG